MLQFEGIRSLKPGSLSDWTRPIVQMADSYTPLPGSDANVRVAAEYCVP